MLTLALLVLAPQVSVTPRPILGPILDAGVYDYATGTLLPPGTTSSAGPDSVYDNTASPAYYLGVSSFSAAPSAYVRLTDVGGIPGPGNTGTFALPADRAEILVNGFEFAYCDERPAGTTGYTFYFSSGAPPPNGAGGVEFGRTAKITLYGLPTGGTYRVRVDLGPEQSFCFLPDGGAQNAGFDGVPALDRFTVDVIVGDSGGVPSGLVLAGNPAATDASFSPPSQPLPRDGDGTYYGAAPSCSSGTTGYLSEDSMIAVVSSSGGGFSGAIDAGGYSNAGGCGAVASAPWTSFYLRLFSDPAVTCAIDCASLPPGGLLGRYCSSTPNSTGANGALSLCGPTRMWELDRFTLTASQLPPYSFGFFLHGPTQGFVPNPAGSGGNLCLSGSIGRFVGPGQIQSTGATGSFSLDTTLGQWSVSALPIATGFQSASAGSLSNFQVWHRDVSPTGMPTSNFSDGYWMVWGYFR